MVVEAGELIPGDGEVVEGVASVDESAITGESAPVIRESGGDRSAVTGGTKVLSDRIVVRITSNPGETFLDRMIALVEGASRQKTPNEIALHILLVGLTLVFLFACVTLVPLALYGGIKLSSTVIVALLVCLIPTTIGGLLSAIGIAGMDRLIRKNVIAMSGRAIEAAGDVDVLLLDKTGTITMGNRMATEFIPVEGVRLEHLVDAAQLASLADETPEGRSIVVLAKQKFHLRARDMHELGAHFIPFSAQTRMSGCDLDGRQIRKGAVDAIAAWVKSKGGVRPVRAGGHRQRHRQPRAARRWRLPRATRVLGIVRLTDVVKGGIKERFARFRAMGIRTVMITGDNPRTAATIAREAGVDDFLAEATPEAKMRLIKEEQAERPPGGHDRRRHQRRPGAGPGRRGGGHEHRHPGGQGGRQHGRPRLEPDQAAGGDRGRQATADDPRRADDVLDRQRRRQIFRHPAGAVHGRLPGDRAR